MKRQYNNKNKNEQPRNRQRYQTRQSTAPAPPPAPVVSRPTDEELEKERLETELKKEAMYKPPIEWVNALIPLNRN